MSVTDRNGRPIKGPRILPRGSSQPGYVPNPIPEITRKTVSATDKIIVVLPVCSKDYGIMLENIKWQSELESKKNFECVLSVDSRLSPENVSALTGAAKRTFSRISIFSYKIDPSTGWPHTANLAFQNTARYMQQTGQPWFWMEADCIPLTSDWLARWNHEYFSCGKKLMGAIVSGMGHCNGTAVYPPDFPLISRTAMGCTGDAWDMAMKRDTESITHDAGHLLCHVWGIERGRATPRSGTPANFKSWRNVEDWVCPGAVLFHRCKDGSLIKQLRTKNNENRNPDRQSFSRPGIPEAKPENH